jgi:hypothetical protein
VPERSRKTTWKEFLTRRWELIVAADFFTVEVLTRRLQRFMVLFFIELSTRKVEIAGIASVPNRLRMIQIGRNLTDAVDGILNCQALPMILSRPRRWTRRRHNRLCLVPGERYPAHSHNKVQQLRLTCTRARFGKSDPSCLTEFALSER